MDSWTFSPTLISCSSTACALFIIRCLFDESFDGTPTVLFGTAAGSSLFSPSFSGIRKLPKSVELLRRPLVFLSEERRFEDSLEDTEEDEEDTGAG